MARMRDFAEFFNNGKRKGDKKGGTVVTVPSFSGERFRLPLYFIDSSLMASTLKWGFHEGL